MDHYIPFATVSTDLAETSSRSLRSSSNRRSFILSFPLMSSLAGDSLTEISEGAEQGLGP